MRNGIAISTLLHAGVVAAVIFGLPDLLNTPIVLEQPIIVELVTITDKTTSQKPIEPSPKKAPPPAPKLKPIATPEPEPEPEPKPEPPVAKAPPPPAAKPAPATPAPPPPEPAKIKPKAVEKPVEVALPKPKPVAKPKPPKKVAATTPTPKAFRILPRPKAKPKRKRRQFNTNRIAALLDKDRTKKRTETRQSPKKSKTAKSVPRRANPVRTQSLSQPMTMSEIDAIRYQIQQCWSIPAGARDAKNLIVRIRVFLNTDGTLAKAPEIVGSNQSNDPFYRAAADSARRAVLKCAPLKNLPVDKYSRWRELTLTFNPRDMLGG